MHRFIRLQIIHVTNKHVVVINVLWTQTFNSWLPIRSSEMEDSLFSFNYRSWGYQFSTNDVLKCPIFGCHGNSRNPSKVSSVTLETMHTFMCQRWNPIFPSGVFLIGKETGSDYKAIIHMQKQDFLHAKNIFEKKQSWGQNKMLLRMCKMWHKDTVGRLPVFYPFTVEGSLMWAAPQLCMPQTMTHPDREREGEMPHKHRDPLKTSYHADCGQQVKGKNM